MFGDLIILLGETNIFFESFIKNLKIKNFEVLSFLESFSFFGGLFFWGFFHFILEKLIIFSKARFFISKVFGLFSEVLFFWRFDYFFRSNFFSNVLFFYLEAFGHFFEAFYFDFCFYYEV